MKFADEIRLLNFKGNEAVEVLGGFVDLTTGEVSPKRTRAPRGTAVKEAPKMADKDGNVPEVGKTYGLNGKWWTRQQRGRAPTGILELIHQYGYTWPELLKKE